MKLEPAPTVVPLRPRPWCLVPLKGDGEEARSVGREIRARFDAVGHEAGRVYAEMFAELLRTARYRDWLMSKGAARCR